jgi:DNA-binding CsgD family transcriptional regulator
MPTTLINNADIYREVLFGSSSLAVLLLKRDGTIIEMNPAAARLLHVEASHPVQLADQFDAAFSNERLRILGDVIEGQTSRSVVEIVRGSMRTTTFHPVMLERDTPGVLWVSEPGANPSAPRASHDDLGVLDGLTDREREMLALLGTGMSNTQMAKALRRSIRTVHWHCASLCEKLGMTRAELARLAVRQGLAAAPK